MPNPRSGHTITFCKGFYVMFGGIVNWKTENQVPKVAPTNETWFLELNAKETFSWKETQIKGDVPEPRGNHVAVSIKRADEPDNTSLLFIHGGIGEYKKYEDAYLLDPSDMSCKRIKIEGDCPAPRANHAACVFNNNIYIFGGNGGRMYENTVFNDMWRFEFSERKWEKVNYKENPSLPEPRSGHTMFSYRGQLCVYGGWNQINAFTNMIIFDIDSENWSNTNFVVDDVPRWNHCGIEVEAVPSWKYFVFGGASAKIDEMKSRERGTARNDAYVCDLDSQKFFEIIPEIKDGNELPFAREDSMMLYYKKSKSLLVFGGWQNEWSNEIYSLSVGNIVGPSYSIKYLEPNKGKISGNQEVKLYGSRLNPGNIQVLFISGNKYKSVTANFISDTEATLVTPNFTEFEPSEVDVKIMIEDDPCTDPAKFTFYLDTSPEKSIFFGPGCIDGGKAGSELSIVIRARNELNKNRESGSDHFKVNIVEQESLEQINCEIIDNQDGTYLVKYTPEKAGRYKISLNFEEDGKIYNLRGSPLIVEYNGDSEESNGMLSQNMLQNFFKKNVDYLESMMTEYRNGVSFENKDMKDINTLINIKSYIKEIEAHADEFDRKLNEVEEFYRYNNLDKKKFVKEISLEKIHGLFALSHKINEIAASSQSEIKPLLEDELKTYKEKIYNFEKNMQNFGSQLRSRECAIDYNIGPENALIEVYEITTQIEKDEETLHDYDRIMKSLGSEDETVGCYRTLEATKNEIKIINTMWEFIKATLEDFNKFKNTAWPSIDAVDMDDKISQGISKALVKVRKQATSYAGIMEQIMKEINTWKKLIPLIGNLKNEAVQERHWEDIKKIIKTPKLKIDENLKLNEFYEMKIFEKSEEITEIAERATNEDKMGKKIKEISANWTVFEFETKPYARVNGVSLMEIIEDQYAILEDNMQHIQTMSRNRFKDYYEKEIDQWKSDLNWINEVNTALSQTQATWTFLESLFIGSEEIKNALPEDTKNFEQIHKEVITILQKGAEVKSILKFSTYKFDGTKHVFEWLKNILERLSVCEKSLNVFMDSKKSVFPRFYFISSVDLLDILSNGNNPKSINKHISKVILAIDRLELQESSGDRPSVLGMHTRVGKEYVKFTSNCKLLGKVEVYLELVLNFMKDSLKNITKECLKQSRSMETMKWIETFPSQSELLVSLINFVTRIEEGFVGMKQDKKCMEKVLDKQLVQLNELIRMVMLEMTEETMAKVMVMIKSETHSRDVIEKLIAEEVNEPDMFQWQSVLKSYWSPKEDDAHLNVADAQFWYGYEYLGNGDRLVVTQLTDRIYVTATQALHLSMGCAPAGPAGTGKTETTKDLASAMGKACYVFNCSDQMDYRGMGEIFRGLASSGSWGCFDEFNRLRPEVLSVCSMQFKSITDALKRKDKFFEIDEKKCDLDNTCGAFITMNPGYIGRAELPEGLKVLFRPITVMVPDFDVIAENSLMAQGFVEAKILSKKFVVLYALCADLLSKQMHYDWGLRAIKSVLVVAGAFKRADPDMSEKQLLKRALRDFNLPKIVRDDLGIFHGLIGDLFPNVEVDRKRDIEFEKKVVEACGKINEVTKSKVVDNERPPFRLFADDAFVLKVIQLKELLEIRHSVFIMGNAGSGKSSCYKTLSKAFNLAGVKTEYTDLNPKSIYSDDLYGRYINVQTRDFKYGILSTTMKSMGAAAEKHQKWIILDGDLDATWIENMNSVMDDNRVLTLPNNDRIDLFPFMRLIFEIRDLKFATKATVSRAGILYIPDEDGYQWKAYIKSWIENQGFRPKIEKEILDMFEIYLPETLKLVQLSKFVIADVFLITFVISLCKMLEAYIERKDACLNPKIDNRDDDYNGLDLIFCFCLIWSCGAVLTEKDGIDFKRNFSDNFRQNNNFKVFKLPAKGMIFDYYVHFDAETKIPKWEDWSRKIPEIEYKPSENIKFFTVPTAETVSISEILLNLLEVGQPSLLIGMAGCGKTQICKGALESNKIKAESKNSSFSYAIVNFNYYTDTNMMQSIFIQNTERFSQKTFIPKGNPKLMAIYIDDLNMQKLDDFMTQNAIELVRQFMDYKHIYDIGKMEIMEFINLQFIAAMNPTAGSFNINPRLQRHFWICAVSFPLDQALSSIYSFFLNGHFKNFSNPSIAEFINSKTLIAAILATHKMIESKFRKSAINFHYEFNIRHITGVFQGVLNSSIERFKDSEKIAKLWIHECERVYGDRLVTPEDLTLFKNEMNEVVKKTIPKWNFSRYFNDKAKNQESDNTLIFCRFTGGHIDNVYDMANSLADIKIKAEAALSDYNESNPIMDLVLFDDAVKHICRITRIISNPSGHALLVGVGGSGKQSLSKLSAFICQYTYKMITVSQEYKINNFKEDLIKYYNITGMSDDSGILFIFTEGQIINEKFMVPVNDLLSSGEVQDLFTNDDREVIYNKLRAPCKAATGKDSTTDIWNFFISRVKKNLHMSICFSPGENLRSKARKFPAIVNATTIDWYQPWPEDALFSVAKEKLEKELEDEIMDKDYKDNLIAFMPYSFKIVGEQAKIMNEVERRYTYITPKSFLELLKLFVSMYKSQLETIMTNQMALKQGLSKLLEAQQTISALEEELSVKSVEITAIKIEAAANDKVAREQAAIVGAEAAKANSEQEIVTEMKARIEEESRICQEELAELLPLMRNAEELASKITKEDIKAVRAIANSPPKTATDISIAVYIMLAGQVDDLIAIEVSNVTRMPKKMANKDAFRIFQDAGKLKEALGVLSLNIKEFKANEKNFANCQKEYGEYFDKNNYEENQKSAAKVTNCIDILYQWCYNMFHFFMAAKTVEPKQRAVDEKKIQLKEAEEKVERITAEVKNLEEKLAIVMEEKRKAEEKLNAAVTEEQRCLNKLDLARRFINALGDSEGRWKDNIAEFDEQLKIIVGDIVIASAFVSYVGPFPKLYRERIKLSFSNFIKTNKIPISPKGDNPLNILASDAEKAAWNKQRLPADPVSIENGAILTNSERWTLLIDPQLQGIQWIREKESTNGLIVTRMNNPKLVNILGECISDGKSIMIENLGEMIDATLGPVIGRNTKKQGTKYVYQLGNSEFVIHDNFRFFLQTKLSNPHYPPEIQAEATLINFTVTEDGLEDQLLDLIVKMERPTLAQRKEEVINSQNEGKIKLGELQRTILKDLNTPGDLLENKALVERLENAGKVSQEVKIAMEEAAKAEIEINISSNFYRPAAARGSLIFFLMSSMYKMHTFYIYSLESYIFVIQRAVNDVAKHWKSILKLENDEIEEHNDQTDKKLASGDENKVEGEVGQEDEQANNKDQAEIKHASKKEEKEEKFVEPELTDQQRSQRVQDLVNSITEFSFNYVRRGLFEKHKLIFSTLLTLRILVKNEKIKPAELAYLIEGRKDLDKVKDKISTMQNKDILRENQIASILALEEVDGFENLFDNILSAAEINYWRRWLKEEKAEVGELPRSVQHYTNFQKLCLIRAMRPDRMLSAMTNYVLETMGKKYIESDTFNMNETFKESASSIPIFFVLFPGVDPTQWVEEQGKICNKSIQNGTFINIPMGEGQEEKANKQLKECSEKGNWIMLQNVHLMEKWLKVFENDLEKYSQTAHPDFRCFVSSEPPPLSYIQNVPESVLKVCIKVANEAPQDLQSNLMRAWNKFDQKRLDSCSKPNEFKSILFGLCFFHSLILGRKKFGPIGWSRNYNFNEGDLTICADVLNNYLEKYEKVPYEDLRYLYGEIMYGGHITDYWDRRTNNSYLKILIKPELLAGFNLAPNFKSPDPARFDYDGYKKYIEDKLPVESPILFYLHSNAEIIYLTSQGEFLFSSVFEIQGGSSTSSDKSSGAVSINEIIKNFMDKLRNCVPFNLAQIKTKTKKLEPYDIVALQECEKLNYIFSSLLQSLEDLEKGLNGELNMTDAMEVLSKFLVFNKVPEIWATAAGYPSQKSLGFWVDDLIKRHEQMIDWSATLTLPLVINLSLLCNPMSFVTAIKQVTARAKGYSLDELTIMTEVTNYTSEDMIKEYPASGVYVTGMFLQGAKWEEGDGDVPGFLTDMLPKELDPKIPIMNIFSLPNSEKSIVGYYECPVYYTTVRGATYIFTAYLRMESEETDPNKWVLAGVSIILCTDE